MRVLSRYLLARFLGAFAAVLLILVLAVAVVELVGDFDDVLSSSSGLAGALTYIGLRIAAAYLGVLIPAAAFAAAFLSLGTAARSLEIVAMKAGGVSPLRVVVPLLVAAAVLSGAGLLLNETLAVRAHEAWRRQVRGGEELTFGRGSFWYHKGPYIYNVREADPETRLLRDVAVFELDPRGRLLRTIQAAQAKIDADGRWALEDAVIRRFDPASPASAGSFERVAHTTLPLAEELALLDADVQGLSIRELREVRDQRPGGDPESVRADALLHQRMTGPLAAFLFVLLAIPLGLRVERTRSLALPALLGVGILFAFFTARSYGATLAVQGITPPAATTWAILALFGLLGAWQLARVPR